MILHCDNKLWGIVIVCMLVSNVTSRILDPGVGGITNFASECKKPRNLGKGKALTTTQKDWVGSNSFEDEIDYDNIALVAISSEKEGSPKSSKQGIGKEDIPVLNIG